MKRFLLFLFATISIVACQTTDIEVISPDNVSSRAILASLESGEDTRIQLQSGKTVWTEGDLVSVFYRSTENEQWIFKGNTGDRTGILAPNYVGDYPEETTDKIVVVYPYNWDHKFNLETMNIETELPQEQNYLANSYGLNGNIMVSQSDYKQINLKSVCGWIKLQLTGNGEQIRSIKLRGNNDEQVAGELYIKSADASCVLASEVLDPDGDMELGGTLVRPGKIYTEVTLNCLNEYGDGVTLSNDVTEFYMALPPRTFENGFTIVIEDIDGMKMTKSTSNYVAIERNWIQPMAKFDFAGTIPANEIWYESDSMVSVEANAFGATSVDCNNYDPYTGKGILVFDKDVTSIADYAFYDKEFRTVTLPDSVTEIGVGVFQNCKNLTTINCIYSTDDGRAVVIDNTLVAFAPASALALDSFYFIEVDVNAIADYAFYNCSDLSYVDIPYSVTEIGNSAFRGCAGIMFLTIPSSITKIEDYAFDYVGDRMSASIEDVIVAPITPPTAGMEIFGQAASYNQETFRIYVPYESYNLYIEAEGWSYYKDYIMPYDFENGVALEAPQKDNEIWYRSVDDSHIEPVVKEGFGDNVKFVGSTVNPVTKVGIIEFDGPVTNIPELAFEDCAFIELICPNSVQSVEQYAFAYCDTLEKVSLPYSATNIGTYAFANCPKLTCAIVGGITTVPEGLFQNCTSLSIVSLPWNTQYIDSKAFENCSSLEFIDLPESISHIAPDAFNGCSSLMYFFGKYANEAGNMLINDGHLMRYAPGYENDVCTIPDGITYIDEYAFYDCDNVRLVNMPESLQVIGDYAFNDCNSLASLTIPESVREIRTDAFRGCLKLDVYFKSESPYYMTVPTWNMADYCAADEIRLFVPNESVEDYKTYWSDLAPYIYGYGYVENPRPYDHQIWYSSFEKMVLNPAAVNQTLISNEWDMYSGHGVLTFDGTVTEINGPLFANGYSLVSLNMSNKVTTIGMEAFKQCEKLQEINLSDNVSSIGREAFADCKSLSEIKLPSSLREIGIQAFVYSSLVSLELPDGLLTIGENAFAECDNLEEATIPTSVGSFGRAAFIGCDSLKEFKGYYASNDGRYLIFNNEVVAFAPAGLTSATIPSGVTRVSFGAFDYCDKLENVTIPEGVYSIDDYAFRGCTILSEVTLPTTIERLGNGVFRACPNLSVVYIKSKSVPEVGTGMLLEGTTYTKLYVPYESWDAYLNNKQWEEYLGYIRPYDYEKGIEYGPGATQIWYTATEKLDDTALREAMKPYADLVMHEFDGYNGKLTFDESVYTIGKGAFQNQVNLRSVWLPWLSAWIEDDAFNGCWNLTNINMRERTVSIGERAFRGTAITSIIIPNNVVEIGAGAFEYTRYLREFKGMFAKENGRCLIVDDRLVAYAAASPETTFELPAKYGVRIIDDYAFDSSRNLETVVLPEGVEVINKAAFKSCGNIQKLVLPSTLLLINTSALRDCGTADGNGYDIYSKAKNPPVVDNDGTVGVDIEKVELHIPVGCTAAYLSDRFWSRVEAIIEEWDL
ncbi:MAG: leucine-rich repeat domain-containing protein [Alistipes sp.]|nr:leucine-rich repeat domain-containing protein [Alistipes sp.]